MGTTVICNSRQSACNAWRVAQAQWDPDTTSKTGAVTEKPDRVGTLYYKEIRAMSEQTQTSATEQTVDAEVQVSPPMTVEQFISGLRNGGFTGQIGFNPNMPGMVWIAMNI
jgi:hypothetical protein